ncbi:unnamed protein product [Rotaria sp. Silwood1]|nr:unnamed protein product [Rotaria sp. Silwood1]
MNGMSTILEDDNDEWTSIDEDNDEAWILYDEDDGEDEDNKLTYHHREPEELHDLDWNDLPKFIRQLDYNSLNEHEHRKAHYENRPILSIQRKLAANNMIIRLPYQGTSFYIASEKDFQQKVTDYVKRTDAYKLILKLGGAHRNASQIYLLNIVEQVEMKLVNLLDTKCINEAHYLKMNMTGSSVRMRYLYFVPETHKEGIRVRPIKVCNDGPTMNIVRYIAPLLWSIFDRATNCKRFSNGAIDVIHAIEHHAQMAHLKPRALFVTFNMDDLTKIFSYDQMMASLKYFLVEHLPDHRMDGLIIDIVLELVHLVLKNQFFVYNNELYQQIHGGASGLLLTMFLAFINVFYGQHRDVIKILKEKNEFFGRYREQVILTWQGSDDQFCTLFNKDIVHTELTRNIIKMFTGSTVHFHDLEISHMNNGTLESKVYYDPNIDTLSNVSDASMENKSKQLHSVLYRAARCCSDVEKFHNERRHIVLSFLTSGFTLEFIPSAIQRFYQEFGVEEKFVLLFLNANEYDHLHQRIIQDIERQLELKQHREREKQHILFLPCPCYLDQKKRDIFKQRFQDWWKKYYGYERKAKHIQIKWLELTSPSLANSDMLVNK